jgi:citrate synthase
MDLCLVLHADHGLNASTFAARVTASTLSDMYSAVTSAISTLRGPLHGGANQRVMQMLEEIGDVSKVEEYVDNALANKQRIMGFGHRVYKTEDPRAALLRGNCENICTLTGHGKYFDISEKIREVVYDRKELYPNVDFYSASVLHSIGIETRLFTTIFAASRVAGWIAHIMEQYADNRLIRPTSEYVGVKDKKFVPMDERG